MVITIDDRRFKARLVPDRSGFPQMIIQLKSEDEIKFFARWAKARQSGTKSNHVKDISFETVSRQGTCKNSWCSLDFNEESVAIRWDSYTYTWKDI